MRRSRTRRDLFAAPSSRIVHVAIAVAMLVVAIAMIQVVRIRRAQHGEVRAALQEELLASARLIADMLEARESAISFLLFAPMHGGYAAADRRGLRLDEFRAFARGRLAALDMDADPRFAVFRIDTAGGAGIAEGDPAVLQGSFAAPLLERLAQPDAGWRRLTAGVFRAGMVHEGVPIVVELSPELRPGGAATWFGIVHSRDYWTATMLRDALRDASVFPATFYGVDIARGVRASATTDRDLDQPLRASVDARARGADGPFAVRLVAADGRTVYASPGAPPPAWSSPHAAELRRADGSVLRVAIPGALGDRIIDAAVPPSAVTWLLGGLAAFGAAFLAAALLELRRRQQVAEVQRRLGAELSHEVRTPLAQIAALSETLLNGGAESPEQERRWLRTIEREARRLGHLANDVLLHERREREPARVAPADVDVHELVADIAESARAFAAGRGVVVAVRVPERFIARVDAGAVRQILLNLVHNALEHGPNGQTIAVGVCRRDGRVVITVDDEGPGVPETEREAIWEPFTRLRGPDGSTGGAGLGLAIVRSLAEAHGGRAGVDEAPGGGARFVVELPG